MPNLLIAEITGYEALTRAPWVETEEGGLYRELLVSALMVSPGFAFRAFPVPNKVLNTFDTKANVLAFVEGNKTLLADMMPRAKAYYELDEGCSLKVSIEVEADGSSQVFEIADLSDPNAYSVPA